jgi:hypothetical protein
MTIKYTNIHFKPLKIYQNWDFGHENVPSGNHAFNSRKRIKNWDVDQNKNKTPDECPN